MIRKIVRRVLHPERLCREALKTTPEWHPPAREIGGVDIPELFVHYLANEMITMVCSIENNLELPLASKIDRVLKQEDEWKHELERHGLYFYEPNGSIFMDYKIMRNKAFQKLGNSLGAEPDTLGSVESAGYRAIRKLFKPDMTTAEALELSRRIVAGWEWELR